MSQRPLPMIVQPLLNQNSVIDTFIWGLVAAFLHFIIVCVCVIPVMFKTYLHCLTATCGVIRNIQVTEDIYCILLCVVWHLSDDSCIKYHLSTEMPQASWRQTVPTFWQISHYSFCVCIVYWQWWDWSSFTDLFRLSWGHQITLSRLSYYSVRVLLLSVCGWISCDWLRWRQTS